MGNVIKNLFFGNIVPVEQINPTKDKDYNEALQICVEAKEKLLKTFDEKQLQLFEEYSDDAEKVNLLLQYKSFLEGFSVANNLIIESILKKD